MSPKRRYLTVTMPDGYVKTIGPTTDTFTHYWRIVAQLGGGKTEVFWGHTRSPVEANIGPNLFHPYGTVSWQTSITRSNNTSTTFRCDSGKWTYMRTTMRITSGEEWK